MDRDGRDKRGRKNPGAWKAWARAAGAGEALDAPDNRATHGGLGARARRRLRRAAERAAPPIKLDLPGSWHGPDGDLYYDLR